MKPEWIERMKARQSKVRPYVLVNEDKAVDEYLRLVNALCGAGKPGQVIPVPPPPTKPWWRFW